MIYCEKKIFKTLIEQNQTQIDSGNCLSINIELASSKCIDDYIFILLKNRLNKFIFDKKIVENTIIMSMRSNYVRSNFIHDMVTPFIYDESIPSFLSATLFSKGMHVLMAHRIANMLWRKGNKEMGYLISKSVGERLAVDIHPAASMGQGIFLDHATSTIIGETAEVGDRVWIFHSVTLGATLTENGFRHPRIEDGAVLCSGCQVLGRVYVGQGAVVGAGALVLKNVPPNSTAVGVPARLIEGSSISAKLCPDQARLKSVLPETR